MKTRPRLVHVGWREWLHLPQLGILHIKAKIDTGARTSSLHAYEMEEFPREGQTWLRFTVKPYQRNPLAIHAVEAKLLEYRQVRSSNGALTKRPVILTTVELQEQIWEIELTLVNRDQMGFRMLLGRQAMRHRVLVDPAHSYLGGVPVEAPRLNRPHHP